MNNPAASSGVSKIMTSRKWLEEERKPNPSRAANYGEFKD